jgi:hypothetical protein
MFIDYKKQWYNCYNLKLLLSLPTILKMKI